MRKYVLVLWPESQELMDKAWFDECVLHTGLPSAYFVPEERYNSLVSSNKEQIRNNLKQLDTTITDEKSKPNRDKFSAS